MDRSHCNNVLLLLPGLPSRIVRFIMLIDLFFLNLILSLIFCMVLCGRQGCLSVHQFLIARKIYRIVYGNTGHVDEHFCLNLK